MDIVLIVVLCVFIVVFLLWTIVAPLLIGVAYLLIPRFRRTVKGSYENEQQLRARLDRFTMSEFDADDALDYMPARYLPLPPEHLSLRPGTSAQDLLASLWSIENRGLALKELFNSRTFVNSFYGGPVPEDVSLGGGEEVRRWVKRLEREVLRALSDPAKPRKKVDSRLWRVQVYLSSVDRLSHLGASRGVVLIGLRYVKALREQLSADCDEQVVLAAWLRGAEMSDPGDSEPARPSRIAWLQTLVTVSVRPVRWCARHVRASVGRMGRFVDRLTGHRLRPVVLRVRRTTGWVWLVMLAIVAFDAHRGSLTPTSILVICNLPLAIVYPLFFAGRQRRTVKVRAWDSVVGPLVRSQEEFCLLLRPFGEDGQIISPVRLNARPGTPLAQALFFPATVTLEQMIASIVKNTLGLRTFGLVDSKFLLAPPGPHWLRATPGEQGWKQPVQALIERAHTIFLILPPGQKIRDAVKWEIRQITYKGLQNRVVIVVPPGELGSAGEADVRRDLCTVLAAFDAQFGDFDDVNELDVDRFEYDLPAATRVVKPLRTNDVDYSLSFEYWYSATDLTQSIAEACAASGREVAHLEFARRYPLPVGPLPPGDPATVPTTSSGPHRRSRLATWRANMAQKSGGVRMMVFMGVAMAYEVSLLTLAIFLL